MKSQWLFLLVLLFFPMHSFAQEESLSPQQIEELSRAVVRIEVYQDGFAIGSGSGTLVLPTGLIYTNRHVVELGDEFHIGILEDPNELPVPLYKASFVLAFTEFDFAVLQIDRTLGDLPLDTNTLDLPYLDAVPVDVQRGEKLYTFGYPGIGDGYLVLAQGQVTTIQNGDVNEQRMPVLYQTDAEISPGMSGGLAVNAQGQYVGLPTEVISEEITGGRLGGILPLGAVNAYLETNGETIQNLDDLELLPSAFASRFLDECTHVNYGQNIFGRIDDVTWLTLYCFEGLAGEVVTIEMTPTSGNLDGILLVFDSRLEETYAYNDDRSGDNNAPSIENFELPQSSTYIIVATRYDLETGVTRGDFTLNVFTNSNRPPGIAAASFDQSPLTFSCEDGTFIRQGTAIDIVQMRQGFNYTTTVLGIDRFDPTLAVLTPDGAMLCVDNASEADNYAVNLPSTGQVEGTSLGARATFSQNQSAFADVSLIIGGGYGEYVVIIEGMAVTEQDNLGDPFRVVFHDELASRNEPVTAYMLAIDRGLDSYIYLWDSQIGDILRDTQGEMLLCDDGGSRNTCWNTQQGLVGSYVNLNGTRLDGRNSDSMLTIPLNLLGEDTVNYLMTSYNYETQGQYIVVFHVRVNP